MMTRRKIHCFLTSFILTPYLASAQDAGIDYEVLTHPAPTLDPQRIEVVEFFRYGCPFCKRLEPIIQAWKAQQHQDVLFRYVPVSFQSTAHQQLFLTLQRLGENTRLHMQAYDAIQREAKSLEQLTDILEWTQAHGVSPQRFESAWHSEDVAQAMYQANALVKHYGVTSVPQFGINGRFRTSPAMAGGSNATALKVVSHLVESERKRRVTKT